MVWPFSASSPSSSQSAKPISSDGGVIAPNRNSRQQCWISRDNFFKCLDENEIVDAIREDDKARGKCGEQLKEFEGACARAWVKYFKEKRVMEYNRDKTIEKIKKEEEAINSMAEKIKR
ncbi:hypothetical protein KEM54_003426 [Ascosphaera aggregata]|nr:hypothetical protein KEM54_003426 [Ascosphaera aggregata]